MPLQQSSSSSFSLFGDFDQVNLNNLSQDFNHALINRFPFLKARPIYFTEDDLQYLPVYTTKTLSTKNYQVPIPLEKIGERNQRMMDSLLEKIGDSNEKEDVKSFFKQHFASFSNIFQELSMDFKVLVSTTMCILKLQRRVLTLDNFLQSICELGQFSVEQVNENPQMLEQFLESLDPELVSSILFSSQGMSGNGGNGGNQQQQEQEQQEQQQEQIPENQDQVDQVGNGSDEVNLTDIYRRGCEYRLYNSRSKVTAIRVNEGSYWFHNEKSFYQQPTEKYPLNFMARYRISLLFSNMEKNTLLNPYPNQLPHLEVVIAITEMMSLKNALDLFDVIKNQYPNHLVALRLDETFDKVMNLSLDPSTFKFLSESNLQDLFSSSTSSTSSSSTNEIVNDTNTSISERSDDFVFPIEPREDGDEGEEEVYHPILYIERPCNQILRMDLNSLKRNTVEDLENVLRQNKFSNLVKPTCQKYLEWTPFPSKFYEKYHKQKGIVNSNLLTIVQNLFIKNRYKPNLANDEFSTKSLCQLLHIIESLNNGQIEDLKLIELIETGVIVFQENDKNDKNDNDTDIGKEKDGQEEGEDNCEGEIVEIQLIDPKKFSKETKEFLLQDWIFVQARNLF
jgi:hypothetical protein